MKLWKIAALGGGLLLLASMKKAKAAVSPPNAFVGSQGVPFTANIDVSASNPTLSPEPQANVFYSGETSKPNNVNIQKELSIQYAQGAAETAATTAIQQAEFHGQKPTYISDALLASVGLQVTASGIQSYNGKNYGFDRWGAFLLAKQGF